MYSEFFASLQLVPDPRLDRKKVYPLDFILLIVFLSTISGCSSWYEMEDYAQEYEDELKKIYESLSGQAFRQSMPTHDTLNRCMSLLSPEAFELAYRSCLEKFISVSSGKHICIDGKTMRGVKKLSFDAEAHTVSAYSPGDLSALAQVYINRKDNEITAIKQLLNCLDLQDNYLSIDAIGTQTEIVETIVSKGGHYVLCVKGNQAHSLQELESYFCSLFKQYIQKEEQVELGHGRIETRCYESIVSPLSLEDNPILSRWAGLQSIHRVSRKREDKKTGKCSFEQVYYISSSSDLPRIREVIRNHWAIENKLHYCLDVFLGQDASKKRAGNVAQIMDKVQKYNLFLYERLKLSYKTSIPRIQKKLARLRPQQIILLKF